MSMMITCPRCGTEYQVERDTIVQGVWRLSCPVCHPPLNRATVPESQPPGRTPVGRRRSDLAREAA